MLYNKKPSFEKPIKTKHYWFFVTFQNSWRQNLKEQVLLKASDLTRIKDINIRLFFILHIDSLFNPTPGIGHRSSTPNFFSFSLTISTYIWKIKIFENRSNFLSNYAWLFLKSSNFGLQESWTSQKNLRTQSHFSTNLSKASRLRNQEGRIGNSTPSPRSTCPMSPSNRVT